MVLEELVPGLVEETAVGPALDAGHPYLYPTTDQRGVPRPDGGSTLTGARADTGAFELDTNTIFSDDFESGDTGAWS